MFLNFDKFHWGLKLYTVNINDNSGLTLTSFTPRSNWTHMRLNEKTVTESFKGKTLQQMIKSNEDLSF